MDEFLAIEAGNFVHDNDENDYELNSSLETSMNRLLDDVETKLPVEWFKEQGLKYIAGYVAYRFRNKFQSLGNKTRELDPPPNVDFINIISKGGLMYPSEELFQAARYMETEFIKYHGLNYLQKKKGIFTHVAKQVQLHNNNNIPFEVLHCLVRTRTYIRLRLINKKISDDNKRRKEDRKRKHIYNRVYV